MDTCTHAHPYTHKAVKLHYNNHCLDQAEGILETILVTEPKWLSWAASIKQLRNKVNTTARITTGVLKRTKFLLQSLKVIALQMIKLEEKDIHGQPRSESCSGWIWPATKLRQHLQFSPLENRVMCSTEFFHLILPSKPHLCFTLQNVGKSWHTESLKAAHLCCAPPPFQGFKTFPNTSNVSHSTQKKLK